MLKDGMRVLIAYDGSAHADAALGDLRRAGLPREAEALLVSVAESLGAVFLKPSLKELFSFSLLILILLFRPAGLFGKRAP